LGLAFLKLAFYGLLLGPAAAAEFSQGHLEWLRGQLMRQPAESAAPALWQLWERRSFLSPGERELLELTLEKLARIASPALQLLAERFLSESRPVGRDPPAERGILQRVWLSGPWRRGEEPAINGGNWLPAGDEKAVFPGRPEDWRLLPRAGAGGLQELYQFLPAAEQASVWVLGLAEVPKDAEALVSAGCAESCTVWLNGVLLFDDRGLHHYAPQQHLARVRLPRGQLVVLARLYAETPQWQFSLAVTGKGGRQVVVESAVAEHPPGEILKRRQSPVKIVDRRLSLADWFADRFSRSKELAQEAEYAFVLSRSQSSDQRQHLLDSLLNEAREEVKRGGADGRTCVLLAEAAAEPQLAMDFLSGALSDPRWGLEARAMLGEHKLLSGQVLEALENLEPAAAAGSERARLGLVDALQQAGLEGRALAAAEDYYLQNPTPAMGLKLASLRYAQSWTQAARELYLKLAEGEPSELQVWRNLMELDIAASGIEEARRWNDKLIELHPHRLDFRFERGRLLAANGRLEEAAQQFEELSRLRPFDSQPWFFLARIFGQLGQEEKAQRCLRKALELSPQDAQLGQYRLVRQGLEDEKFYAPWKLRPQQALGLSSPLSGIDADLLYQLTVVRWRENGAIDQFNQKIYRVKTPAGVEQLSRQHIIYVPERQRLEIETATLLRPEGESDGRVVQEESSLSEPWAGMFFDLRSRTVTFTTLRPGDVLELSWLIEDTGEGDRPQGYFSHLQALRDVYPVFASTVVLQAPEGRRLFTRAPGYCRQTKSLAGRQQLWVWECRPGAPLLFEPNTPAAALEDDWFYAASFEKWADLAQWYRRHISDRIAPGQRVRQLAAELTASMGRPEQKARALYRYVADEIRYLAVEYGRHGVIPAPADEVLHRGFGDCKDKSALLVALLDAAGVEALPVLVKSGWGGELPRGAAALEFFDHALVYLPQLKWWLDPSVRYFGPNQLPAELQGIAALPIGSRQVTPMFTPMGAVADNHYRLEMKIRPDEEGNGRIWLSAEVGGVLAPYLRQQFAASASEGKVIEQFLAGLFGQVEQIQGRALRLDEFEWPVLIQAEMVLPAVLKAQVDGSLCIPALGRNTYYQNTFAGLPRRQTDLALGPGWLVEWRVELDPPSGMTPEGPLPGGRVEDQGVTASLQVSEKNGAIEIAATFQLQGGLVTAADYPQLRQALERADRLLSAFVCLKGRAGGGGP
jgi:transglutaminase-like putative cysteine protease/tetratricopeptide (TPR) repeat protein